MPIYTLEDTGIIDCNNFENILQPLNIFTRILNADILQDKDTSQNPPKYYQTGTLSFMTYGGYLIKQIFLSYEKMYHGIFRHDYLDETFDVTVRNGSKLMIVGQGVIPNKYRGLILPEPLPSTLELLDTKLIYFGDTSDFDFRLSVMDSQSYPFTLEFNKWFTLETLPVLTEIHYKIKEGLSVELLINE